MHRSSLFPLAAALAGGLTALAAGQSPNCAKAPSVSAGTTSFTCQDAWGSQLTQSNATTGSTTIHKIGYFAFTPDSTARYFFGVCGASSDTKMALGEACPTGATVRWTVLGYNDDAPGCLISSGQAFASRLNPTNSGLPLTATLNAGQTYYLGVGAFGATTAAPSGNLTIEIEPPPYEPCAAPAVATLGNNVVPTSTSLSLPSLDLGTSCTVAATNTLFKVHYAAFVAPYDGVFIANTCRQTTDLRMAVLTVCGDASTTIACNDNRTVEGAACPALAAAVEFAAVGGQTYFIGFGVATATAAMPAQVLIDVRDASVPLPSPCDPEFVLDGVVGVQQVVPPTQYWFPNLNMAGFCDPGPFGDDTIYRPTYIRFTAPASGTITVSNCTDLGASVDARIAAMTVCGDPSTVFVCDDDGCTGGTAPFTSRIIFEGSAGMTYYFAVGGYSATVPGPYNVTIDAPEDPGIPEDLNGDGVVDAADLAILLSAWGTKGPGDFNGDGTVDAADLAALLAAWTV